jgi:hypothetical protein
VEPRSATDREVPRFRELAKAEDLDVERAGVSFAAARHRQLHVVETEDGHSRILPIGGKRATGEAHSQFSIHNSQFVRGHKRTGIEN